MELLKVRKRLSEDRHLVQIRYALQPLFLQPQKLCFSLLAVAKLR